MPPPRGNPDGPPRALIIDSWFDNYVGVVMLVRVVDGRLAKGERFRLMATNAVYGIEQLGVFTPKSVGARGSSKAGEVGFIIAGIKRAAGGQGRRHHHAGKEAAEQRRAGQRAAAGLQGDQAAGLRRAVPDRGQRLRAAARRAGEAQAQRRVAALRARGQPGAGLRLPLRLPRPAAHGDRAGAARARVRPGPDHHRAQRGLPGRAERRRRWSRSRTRRKMPDLGRIERDPRADRHACTCTCRRSTSAR